MIAALQGITVLDCGLLVQAPQAAATLSDMGANVIKVELPEMGDQARWIMFGPDDPRSAYFTACNRGKRSITLDLRHPDGASAFKRLAAKADVVITNFKPGTMDEWGLGYDTLRALNPRLIWAAGSAFGPIGPDALREGADLSGQAAGGLVSTTGREGDPPTPVGITIADHIASQNMVSGILGALLARTHTGEGQRVEVSLLGGQIWAQAPEYSHLLMTGEIPGRANYGHPLIPAVYRIFETADGWIGIIGVPPASRDVFFIMMERPELIVDPRFSGDTIEREHVDWLKQELEPIFRTKTTDTWCELLREAGVRYAPVRNQQEVLDDPGAWENGYFQEVDGVRVVGTPINMSATPLRPGSQPPGLGEHTREVLLEQGFGDEEIDALSRSNAT